MSPTRRGQRGLLRPKSRCGRSDLRVPAHGGKEQLTPFVPVEAHAAERLDLLVELGGQPSPCFRVTPGQGLEPWAVDRAIPASEPNMAPVQAKRPIAYPAESG